MEKLSLPLELVSKLIANDGIDAGSSSQRLLKWSYRCHPVIAMPLSPCRNFGLSVRPTSSQLRLFSKCRETSGTMRVSPKAPLNALDIQKDGNT